MKKYTISIIFLVLLQLKTQAQDYLISFAAIGDTSVVTTVFVENLTSGAKLTLSGSDILHLTSVTGIADPDFANRSLRICPNPMAGLSQLKFDSPVEGNAVITLVDLSGRIVCKSGKSLSPGSQSFRISGIKPGMYFIKVKGVNYTYSAKLISQSNLQGEAKIEFVSSENNPSKNQLKSIASTIDMPYTTGDVLLYKSTSGKYSSIVTDIPTGSKTITSNFVASTDADNNNYSTVNIGNQVWMAENLKTTRYNDGTPIPRETDNTAWQHLGTPACAWLNNDSATYHNMYGVLYNGFAVGTGKLAPKGWHVPSDAEWDTLITYLGGTSIAGGKLKESGTSHWLSPNTGATNETGFTALPGSEHEGAGSPGFGLIGRSAWWWSSTQNNANNSAGFISVSSDYESILKMSLIKTMGFSVRCIKDYTVDSLIHTEAAINDTLLMCYSKSQDYVELTYLFDAVYSNAVPAPDGSWSDIYNHAQTANNGKVLLLWSKAYDIIYKTNLIIKSAEIAISDQASKDLIIAQAKAIRGYIYYTLLNWFGAIPLEAGISESMIPQNSVDEVLQQIKLDATEASLSLPMSWSISDKFRIPRSFAYALLARTSLYGKNYSEALNTTQQITNSGMYMLGADTSTIANAEIFWGFEKKNNSQFNDFFNKGSNIPVIRYTESFLISAEAMFNTGNTTGAINYFNILNARRGKPSVTSLTTEALFQQWNLELSKEGMMFIILRRFDKALTVVQNDSHKLLLPIPLTTLIGNVNLLQNPGY